MTIDELTTELKRFPETSYVLLKYNHVTGGWGELDSYRGYYRELAVSTKDYDTVTVAEVIKSLYDSIGVTYTGYKGGEYTMDGGTEVYWADYGRTGPITSKVYFRGDIVYIECEED